MPYYRVGKYEFKIEGDAPSEGEIARMQAYLKKNDPDTLAQFPDPSTGYTAKQEDTVEARVRKRFGLADTSNIEKNRPDTIGAGRPRRTLEEIRSAPPSPLDTGLGLVSDLIEPKLSQFRGLMDRTFRPPEEIARDTNASRLQQWRGLWSGLMQ